MATNIKFKSGNREYEWMGGYGAVIKSKEKGINQGDVRIIEDELFYAYIINNNEVSWSMPHIEQGMIIEFKKRVFGLEYYNG